VQRLTLKLCLLVLLLLLAIPAFADLLNANVTVNYLYPDINTIYQVLGTGTVTSSGFTVNSFGQHDFTVYPDMFTLTNVTQGDIQFTPASFNGYQIVVNTGGTPITGVMLEFTDIAGFTISDVTFDSHDVWVNLQGLTTTPGLDLQIGLEFAGGTVPEPSSLLLMGSGALAVIGLARRKLRR
jgi:hypothetical protein